MSKPSDNLEGVTAKDISTFGGHPCTCECGTCKKVKKFVEELNRYTKWKLITRDD